MHYRDLAIEPILVEVDGVRWSSLLRHNATSVELIVLEKLFMLVTLLDANYVPKWLEVFSHPSELIFKECFTVIPSEMLWINLRE